MTTIEIIAKAQAIVYDHDKSKPFSEDELATIEAALALGKMSVLTAEKTEKAESKPEKTESNDVKPLTLKELETHDGSVFVAFGNEKLGTSGNWCLLKSEKVEINDGKDTEIHYGVNGHENTFLFKEKNYGKTWAVYTKKPKTLPSFPVNID